MIDGDAIPQHLMSQYLGAGAIHLQHFVETLHRRTLSGRARLARPL